MLFLTVNLPLVEKSLYDALKLAVLLIAMCLTLWLPLLGLRVVLLVTGAFYSVTIGRLFRSGQANEAVSPTTQEDASVKVSSI